jgi:hypothetical protein
MVPPTSDRASRDDLATIPTEDLLELHRRLTRQQRWLEQRWREAEGDAPVVVHLLRLWAEGSAVAEELERRRSAPTDDRGRST